MGGISNEWGGTIGGMSNVGPATVTSAAECGGTIGGISNEWGGTIGGISKPAKAGLATAQATDKATRLNFIIMTPVKSW